MSEPTLPKPDAEAEKRQREAVEALLKESSVNHVSSVTLADGRRLDYEMTAGFIPVVNNGIEGKRGEVQAAVYTVAYLVNRADVEAPRPLCFAFNGGPGSASIWLHLGALGPKRVPINDDGTMPRAPYAVVDNPLTWLEHFDLVFVDPPHTGYSISASDDARKRALSVDGDVEMLAEVVRCWLSRHKRFGSALYLAGESYGTTRGAAIVDKLLDLGVALSGVILISCAMDFLGISFDPRNDLPYALFLPAFANVAQYHGRLKGSLAVSGQAAREAAEAFAGGEYLSALHAGSRLDGRARTRVQKRIAELTGLPVELVQEKNLRISDTTFFLELLRDAGRIVGRLEARVTGPMAASRTREWEFDPGIQALEAPYTMAALAYFAQIGIVRDSRYEVLAMDVNKGWDFNRGTAKGHNYTCTSTDLSRALRRNPHLRVLAASGRYDLGTPYSASDWSLAQLDVPADVLERVTHRHYDAGHMMYTRGADLRQLNADLGTWLGLSVAGA